MSDPLLSVQGLKKHYTVSRGGFFSRETTRVRAVDGISFDIQPGEALGLVGESGCGKSTAASSILRLTEPTTGEVIFNGGGRGGAARNDDGTHPNDVTRFGKRELKAFRRDAQLIFQDPTSSFDPRMSVGASIAEPLLVHGMADRNRRRVIVEDLLERVGLSADDYNRYPHEFSGGQKQRLALARALVLDPDLLVADEPVSALDVSIQADILALIDDLRTEFGLSILFISHDISVVRELCDRTAVMYLGEIAELGPTEAVFERPQHPYTEALLSAVPTPDPRSRSDHIELTGSVPSPSDPPDGCRFHTRCHRVVQPSGIDLEQAVWRRVLDFRERVLVGEIDADSVRERLRAGGEAPARAGRGADSEPVADGPAAEDAAQVRVANDLPETLSDANAERALADAIDALLAGDDDRAAAHLDDAFTTPCSEIDPEFTTHGPDHTAACIRHQPEYGEFDPEE